MKKLTVYSFPDKNPEYLQLQIDSFNKYMNDGNTELVIINASTQNKASIDKICADNNILSIEYTGPRNVAFSRYYVEQLNWFRDNIQSKSSDYMLFIHSDMFFINKLDYKKLLSEKKLYFNPQYRKNNEFFYMWDGVVLFDSEYMNSNNLTQYFNWDYIQGISDVGGQTYPLLQRLNPSDYGFFNMFNIYDINNNLYETHLNGNIRLSFNLTDKKINEGIPLGTKCFPYEDDQVDYNEYYVNTFLELKKNFVDGYNFPLPVHIDIIQIKDHELSKSPILHFKSGSGYQPFYDPNYSKLKLTEITKIIRV